MPTPKSALVHIGIAKTGTTSIQAVLRSLARVDRLQGIAVPQLGRFDQSFLPAAYQAANKLPRSIGPTLRREPDEVRNSLRTAWLDALRQSTSIVVSCEFLALFSDEEVAQFRRDLVDCGYERLQCLVYVRDPAALYLSLVQQNLKASASFRDPAQFHPGYRERIERWRSLFDEQVAVRLFRPDGLVEGDVVADFLAQLSAFFGVGRPALHSRRQNKSMSAEGMIVLQRYRRHVHPKADDRFLPDSNRLLELISEVEPTLARRVTAPRLHAAIERMIYRQTADDVGYLSERFGIDVSSDVAGDRHEAEPSSFADVASILDSWDPAALDELHSRLLSALLRSAGD